MPACEYLPVTGFYPMLMPYLRHEVLDTVSEVGIISLTSAWFEGGRDGAAQG